MMQTIGLNDYTLLELAATKPLCELSPFHLAIARRLEERGFMRTCNGYWYPTAAGLVVIRKTLH